jgi:predicted enzyme related to lactoylglutathione lyase
MAITHIGRTTIYVDDQDRAKAFYTETLGFELVLDMPMGEPGDARWIEVRPPGAQTNVVLFQAAEGFPKPGGMNPALFETDDIKATADDLRAKGVELPTEPEFAAWGKWWATFKDSEGNEFGLGQDG